MKFRDNFWVAVCYGIAVAFALGLLGILGFVNVPKCDSAINVLGALFKDPESGPLMRVTASVAVCAMLLAAAYLSPLARSARGTLGLLVAGCLVAIWSWVVARQFAVVLTLPVWPAFMLWRAANRGSSLSAGQPVRNYDA